MPEPAALVQRLLDVRVGVEDALSAEQLHGVEKMAARSDRRINLEPVLLARQKIVGAVTRRGMHRTRALLERNVVGKHRDRIALVQRMPELETFQQLALHSSD